MNKPVTCTSARSRQRLSGAATAFFCTALQADIDMDPMSSCESSKGPLQSRHVDKGVCFNPKHRVTSLVYLEPLKERRGLEKNCCGTTEEMAVMVVTVPLY